MRLCVGYNEDLPNLSVDGVQEVLEVFVEYFRQEVSRSGSGETSFVVSGETPATMVVDFCNNPKKSPNKL